MMLHRYIGALLIGLLSLSSAIATEVRGIVIKADPAKGELMIEGRGHGLKGSVLTFVTNKDTQILVERKVAALTDVQPGKRVRVVFEMENGQRVARMVNVNPLLPLVREALPLLQQAIPQLNNVPLGGAQQPGPAAAMPAPLTALPAPAPIPATGFQGTLRRISPSDREIVVIEPAPRGGRSREATYIVPDDTRMTRDGKPISFDDLREGESVTVTFESLGNRLFAKTIQAGAVVPPEPVPAMPPSKSAGRSGLPGDR